MIEPLLPEDMVNIQIQVEENGDRTLRLMQ